MQIEDDDPPSTGKLKGGPKKIADVKSKVPLPKTKASAPKAEKAGKGLKAPKMGGGKGGKISVPKGQNFVKPHLSVKKADSKFSIPKPGMPKKSGRRR